MGEGALGIGVLAWSACIGMTAGGAAVALRRVPWVERRVADSIKPWACDVCLSLWCTVLAWTVYTAAAWTWSAFLAIGPAYAIALAVLRKLTEPMKAPLPLPDLEDLG